METNMPETLCMKVMLTGMVAVSSIKYSAAQVCGGIYTARQGVVTSPRYPEKYENNLDCEYIIQQPSGYQITITFTDFSLEPQDNCSYDFVEIHDGAASSSPLTGKRYCNNTIPPVLRTTQNVVFIRFHTDSSVVNIGFNASYSAECGGYFTASQGVLVSPFYTEQSPNNSDCEYLVIQPSGYVISLLFLDINLGMGDRCNYTYLEIHDGASLTSPLLGDRICNVTFPSSLITTQNAMLIHFKKNESETIQGFRVSYSSAACDVNLTESHSELISPFYPNTFESNWDCMYIIRQPTGHLIELSLFDFDMGLEAACTNILQIYDGESLTSPLLGDQFCNVTLPMTLRSTQQAMLIHYKRNGTENFRGFNASYNTAVCHGNFTKQQGIISSPFYPDTYGNDDCVYVISQPARHLIELLFFDLDLGENTSCNSSFIEVHDGMSLTSSLLGDRLCPGALPRTLRSTQNFMLIHMKTNGSLELRGFNAYYHTTECGGNFTKPYGEITSPFFPCHYDNMECVYVIKQPVGFLIELEITNFSLAMHASCNDEFIKVYDGENMSSKLLEVLSCNDTFKKVLKTTQNTLMIHMRTDNSGIFMGYNAFYKTVCEGNFTSPQGMIIVSTDERMDVRDLECVYVISQPLGYRIKLSFIDLNLETGQLHVGHYSFTIVDVGPSNSSNLREWRCTKLPLLVTSTHSTIQIRFNLICVLLYLRNNVTFNISYTSEPTISSPIIHGYKTGEVLQIEGSLTMTCIVKGGKPLVDSVIFSCPGHTDSGDFEELGGVISTLSINPLKASDNGSICVCTSVWMYETWDKLNETRMLLVNGSEQISSPSSSLSSMNWTVAGCAIAIILIVITIILVKRRYDDVISADHHQPCRNNDNYTDDYLISSGYLQLVDTCGSNTRPASSNYETPLKTDYLQPIFTIDSQTTTAILEGDHSSTDRPCSQQKEE